MLHYQAPLEDIHFLLCELHPIQALQKFPAFADLSPDLVQDVLSEAAKFCQEVLLPLTQKGDAHGCQFVDGQVTTPPGFQAAYRQFQEMGWGSMSLPENYDGQGLPKTLGFVLDEMICAANLSFGMYPGLSHGAIAALIQHGSDSLKASYLPQMVAGKWAGTMCLTEPHAGTDLGLLRSHVTCDENGQYRLSGEKIFISGGEQDLTENIIHMVLARLPDAPAGVKGISLFLVPKFIPDAHGYIGQRNQVYCTGLEHKMGIHACSTCSMHFDGAAAWLVGAPHKGLKAMFTMMNAARLGVGLQGLGLAETAYQMALAYAQQREQGRVLTGHSDLKRPADRIIQHPQIQKSLQIQAAYNQGCRALAYYLALQIDVADHHPDPVLRQQADDYVQLMTPIIKAFFTDIGFDNCNRALQIFGGHGYIREWGMEQLVRDARITQIYEGTNGIQALDLVGRKLPKDFGRYLRSFCHPALARCQQYENMPQFSAEAAIFRKNITRLQQASGLIAQTGIGQPEKVAAISDEYLCLFAHVALADQWMQMMVRADQQALSTEMSAHNQFYPQKMALGRFYMQYLMSHCSGLFAQIMGGLTQRA